MLISACMIVKNEEEMLKKTLPALASGVDEIILVDTGSTDGTVEAAGKFGAKIYNFPWVKDFSAARNESLKYAKGEWIIWIDADEFIKPEEWAKIREFLGAASDDAYNIRLCECDPGEFEQKFFYFRTKIFRNGRGIHFSRPINEQLVSADNAVLNGKLISSVSIYHWGHFLPEGMMIRKKERNIDILQKVAEESPQDINYRILLGDNYRGLGIFDKAIEEYGCALEIEKKPEVYVNRGWCFYSLKNPKEAYASGVEAIKLNDKEAGAYNLMAAVCLGLNRIDRALEIVRHGIGLNSGNGQNRYMANYLLGKALLKKGDSREAAEAFKKAYSIIPKEEVKKELEDLKWA